MHAVRTAEPSGLALKVRTLHCIASLVIDKTVPNIDVDDVSFFGVLAIELIEIA
jgi:hypothetical protein